MRLAVRPHLQEHHLGLDAHPHAEAELLLEGVSDALQVAARVGVKGLAVLVVEVAVDARHLRVPTDRAPGIQVGDADELGLLLAEGDVPAVAVDTQVHGGAVDVPDAVARRALEVRGGNILAVELAVDGDEREVGVLDAALGDLGQHTLQRLLELRGGDDLV